MYIYIHIYIRPEFVYTYIHTYMHTCIHAYICTFIGIQFYVRMYTWKYTRFKNETLCSFLLRFRQTTVVASTWTTQWPPTKKESVAQGKIHHFTGDFPGFFPARQVCLSVHFYR